MSLYVGVLKEVGEPELFELGELGLYYRCIPVSWNGKLVSRSFNLTLIEFISTPIPLEQYLISRL